MNITLTGADERTPIADLIRLADLGAEIGLLYTFDPEGRHRYPRSEWILEAAAALQGRAAIHVCGGRAREQLLYGDLDEELLGGVKRLQVNGTFSTEDAVCACLLFLGHTIITQHTPKNSPLLTVSAPNHALLVDGSGGRGVSPERWERPQTSKPVGFAGGLGPDNLREELPKIAAVAQGHYWIDMEGKLRDADDWFSVEKAMRVMEIWREFCGKDGD